jgi:hypothetical protein
MTYIHDFPHSHVGPAQGGNQQKRKGVTSTILTNIFLRFVGGITAYHPFPGRLLAFLPIDLFDLIGTSLFVEEV